MPNHCKNVVTVTRGEVSVELSELVGADGKFDFARFVPPPPHIYQGGLGQVHKEFFPVNWLSWNRENWGTKWDAYDQNKPRLIDGGVSLRFETAWSPPLPVALAVSRTLKARVHITWVDEGHVTWGEAIFDSGDLLGLMVNGAEHPNTVRIEPADAVTIMRRIWPRWAALPEDEDGGAE